MRQLRQPTRPRADHRAALADQRRGQLPTPFLPHSAQKVHELLGGTGGHTPMPSIVEVEDLDGGPAHPVLTGELHGRRPVEVGAAGGGYAARGPKPVFRTLDPSAVEEELERLGG